MNIPIDVKNKFDRSAPLTAHIERRVEGALRMHAAHVRRVEVRLSDVNGPRGGADDKLTSIDVSLHPSGQVLASAAADDVYVSVTRAAARTREALTRAIGQREQRGR